MEKATLAFATLILLDWFLERSAVWKEERRRAQEKRDAEWREAVWKIHDTYFPRVQRA
jgi:hypothetical protein